MRSTPFKTVFDRVVRLHGRDPRQPLSSDLAGAVVDHINERVGTIWQGWRWPEWEITEERAFRPIWGVTEQYLPQSTTDGRPDEVFYLGDNYEVGGDFGDNYGYYRVIDAGSDPAIGVPPSADPNLWEAFSPVDTFIAYDQRDRRSIGMMLGVYSCNPRVPTSSNNGGLRYAPSEKGIDVQCPGTLTVFITHKMPQPDYTMLPYVVGKTYARGDVVFYPATSECYQAVRSTSVIPTNTSDWNWVPFLSAWLSYVVDGAFADSLMEFDQGGNAELQAKMVLNQYWNKQADDGLQSEVDALTTQGQTLQWNFCKKHQYWRESQPWSGNTVHMLTATDTGTGTMKYRPEIISLLTVDGTPSLQGYPSASLSLDTLIVITVDALQQSWRVDPGPADPVDTGQITPADYNAGTNDKHYTKVL